VLLGPVGVGKSHAAVAATRGLHHDGHEVQFLPVVELLDLLRPGGPERALYDLANLDVLIVDDLGSERGTDWTAERLYALVNRRWLEETPTVFTSNLSPPDLQDALGERTFSRIVGNDAVTLTLSGRDRRRNHHAQS
jgi:DNA replication protein DnaC